MTVAVKCSMPVCGAAKNPALQISVFVDWHRAQRGLIGKQKSEGNAGMYREYASGWAKAC
jgi:hypothetical protein